MSDPEITPSEPEGGPDAAEIVNPEDIPSQVEVTEHDGVSRIDIPDDAETRPGESDPVGGDTA